METNVIFLSDYRFALRRCANSNRGVCEFASGGSVGGDLGDSTVAPFVHVSVAIARFLDSVPRPLLHGMVGESCSAGGEEDGVGHSSGTCSMLTNWPSVNLATNLS